MTTYKPELAREFLERFGWKKNAIGDWQDCIVISPLPAFQAVEVQRARLNAIENYLNVSKVKTRQLLAWRDRCYLNHGDYDPTNTGYSPIPLCVILVELANREHVPSKQEGKEARRLAAKRKK